MSGNYVRTEGIREKLREANKGRHLSPATEFQKGHVPWNKGKCHSKVSKEKMSEFWKGKRTGKDHPLWGKHHTKTTKEKMSLGHAGKFGELSSNWKGGITLLVAAIRNSVIYKLWRRAVFLRDGFQCQDCGKIGGVLEAHHSVHTFSELLEHYNIVSVGQAVRTEELWDVSHGVTVCIKCHRIRDKTRRKNADDERRDDKQVERRKPES